MKTEETTQVGRILRTLQERAKELNCLYRVERLLRRAEVPLEQIFRDVIEVLPEGWQYPGVAQARIVFEDTVIQAPDYQETVWIQSAYVVVQGQPIGTVEVSYRRAMPRADEGPFLREERKLIDSVAERIASVVLERRLRTAFTGWEAALAESPQTTAREWSVVIEFLRGTDPSLLRRITRKMINHLSWSGIPEAKQLVQRYTPGMPPQEASGEDNRPAPRGQREDLTDDVFRLAEERLGEGEILASLAKWIREEKSSFLVKALENQDTPLGEIIEALERYRHAGVDEGELPLAIQKGLRVSLLRRFFSDDLPFIDVAKNYVRIRDFYDLLDRIALTPRCHGKLGGKGSGLFLAQHIAEHAGPDLVRGVKVPKTWYIPSDGIVHFIHYNDLDDVLNRKYLDIDQVRQEYPHLVQLFKRSSFPPLMVKGIAEALDDFGTQPIIVRSSSLLEDRQGSAFSGKYKSLFLGNQGPREQRLAALMDAIAEVYASVFGPDPIEYRAERGLLELHEEMGILVQEVVGRRAGKYFFPACAGVAFSNNEFRWSPRIKRADGLVRLVPGLGTRAVDRVAEDYPVLIAPGQPALRVNVSVQEVLRYSPKMMDVINLETNGFETIETTELLREVGAEYPQLHLLVSKVDQDRVHAPMGLRLDPRDEDLVFTFDNLSRNTPFVRALRELLEVLREAMKTPVDIEFAWDGTDLYLLQCRPQSSGADVAAAAIPADLPQDKVLFSANRFVSNGRVPDITHIVYVDPDAYSQLAPDAMRAVGRAVGRLNKTLPKRQFVLLGPGRWGSRGDIKLGVPVGYSDINNTAMLIEIARQQGNYLPDLSFGTHFFQDLVEASIRYLPLYPDEPGVTFNEAFLTGARNILGDLLPDAQDLAGTLRVIDVRAETGGQVLRVLMNAEIERAVAFLSAARQGVVDAAEADVSGADRAEEDHSRWRLRMAQRIAAEIDCEAFGVSGVYLVGSVKNGTANAGSDIDLLVHVHGDEEQRRALEQFLAGWSKALAEMNYLRTGVAKLGLIDPVFLNDDEIQRGAGLAAKIHALTDPARPLETRRTLDRGSAL